MGYLTCKECLERRRAGFAVRTTLFARLTDHLHRFHGVERPEAVRVASVERAKSGKSKGGRNRFMCGCGIVTVKKGQHLRSGFHPELRDVAKGHPDFQAAMGNFKKVEKKREEKRKEEEVEVEEDGGDESVEVETEVEEEVVKQVLQRVDVLEHTKSHPLMRNRRDYEDVKAWGEQLQSRLGGSYSQDQIELAKLMAVDMLSNLSAATNKLEMERRVKRRVLEEAVMPTCGLEKVEEAFYQSSYVKGTLARWRGGGGGDDSKASDIRAIIMITIALNNGTRTGEFRHLKIKHFQAAVPFEDGTYKTITLDQHKTAAFYTAMLHLKDSTYQDLHRYIEVTGGFGRDPEEYVFRSGDGDQVEHSSINTWIQVTWKRAGLHEVFKGFVPSLTNFRKLLTTTSRERDNNKADEVAHMMCHRRRTADQHYDVRQSRARSQNTFLWVAKSNPPRASQTPSRPKMQVPKKAMDSRVKQCSVVIQQYNPHKAVSGHHPKTTTTTDLEEASEDEFDIRGAIEDFDFYKRRAEETLAEDEDKQTSPIQPSQPSDDLFQVKIVNRWTKEETEEVKAVFKEDIALCAKKKCTIPVTRVRELRGDRWPKFSTDQVRQKIRCLTRNA